MATAAEKPEQPVSPSPKGAKDDPPATPIPPHKIAERLQFAVESSPPTKNRSPELIPLTTEYESFKKRLRAMVGTLKAYKEATHAMQASRDELVRNLSVLAEKSPIYEHVGQGLDGEATEALQAIMTGSSETKVVDVAKAWEDRNEADFETLAIAEKLVSTQAFVNAKDYDVHVLQYAMEWDKIVTERVDVELKHVRKLHADRTHYETKVDGLRDKVEGLEKKGKSPPKKQNDHLSRNETKLKEAYTVHEAAAGKLCVLMDQVMHNCWLDLYQLVKNYIKWESNRVGRESDIYCELAKTLDGMKTTFKSHSKSSQPQEE